MKALQRQANLTALEDGAPEGAKLVPENAIDRTLLHSLISSAVNERGKFRVARSGKGEPLYAGEAYFSLSDAVEWDEQGNLQGYMIIEDSEDADFDALLSAPVVRALFWVTYSPYPDRIEVWWGIEESDYNTTQSNVFPYPPVLFQPAAKQAS